MNSALLSVASGGSLVDIDGTMFIQMGIFLCMFVVLYFLLFRPVVHLIEARREATEGTTNKAEKTLEEARAMALDVDEQLRDIRSAAAAERERMLEQARSRERDLINAAQDASKEQMLAARDEMEKNAQDVKASLGKDVEALSDMVTSRILNRAL